MPTIELNTENFTDTIESSETILIDFWASWCQPCLRFAPVFEAAAEKYPDVTFAKLDTQANPEIATALEISSIPTLMVLKGGMLLYREPGALSSKQLEGLVEQVKGLDIAELKAEAEAHAADHQH